MFLFGIAHWCFYLCSIGFSEALTLYIQILFWVFCSASIGYIINDWYDVKYDELAGKENFVANLNRAQVGYVLVGLIVLLLVPLFWSANSLALITLSLLQLLLYVLYSHPYFRWKEKLWLGVIADSLYAFVLPCLVVVFYCNASSTITVLMWLAFVGWLVSAGVRNILLHQLSDVEADRASKINTVPLAQGAKDTYSTINNRLIPVEVASVFLFLILTGEPRYVVLIMVLCWFVIKGALVNGSVFDRSTWETSNHPSFGLLNNFYEQIIPLNFLLLLSMKNTSFFWLLLLHGVLFWINIRELAASILAFCIYLRSFTHKMFST